jgi:hypothetical protein
MSAAAFMIRDGDMLGSDVTILEEFDAIGGKLDGSRTPEAGYVLRGGRMIESKYLCPFDLFVSTEASSLDSMDSQRPNVAERERPRSLLQSGRATARLSLRFPPRRQVAGAAESRQAIAIRFGDPDMRSARATVS